MPLPISQIEYVTYTRCLNEVKVVEQCYRKEQLFRIGFLEGHFVKLSVVGKSLEDYKTIFEKLSPIELKELQNKINFINSIHYKLKQGELKERNSDDCAPLAAEFYNASLKTIAAWNNVFKKDELHIDLPTDEPSQLDPCFTDKTIEQVNNEKALVRYFELLEKYPKLKREGELNDYTKGTYQIIYNIDDIFKIQKEVYQRLYNKAKDQGLSNLKADELAINFSRPGVVCEDQFWLWIRDVVISPQGYKHTYNRIVWKCDLERIGGAAALPIILEDENKKIIVQLAFRHATNSWEFEMPRGGSKANETSMDTAKREILEETGYETDNLVSLGSITPDSGLTASIVPIFLGKVTIEKETKQDKTEAIKGKYAFNLAELMEGLKRGYMEVEINEKITQVPIRDPFLAYALLMAQYDMHL
jgi:ADP-ribose pyrophosphatase YjhB (NUDIX family)